MSISIFIIDIPSLVLISSEALKHEIVVTAAIPSTPGINLTELIPPKNVVGKGYNATIYAIVENQGDYKETNIQVDIYWSNSSHFNQTIYSHLIPEMPIGQSLMFNTTWNTEALAYGRYNLSAYALPVPGEENQTNNLSVFRDVLVLVPGDVTGTEVGVPQGCCEMRDIGYITAHFGSTPLDPYKPHGYLGWNPNCDINNDGVVNMRDIGISCRHFLEDSYPFTP